MITRLSHSLPFFCSSGRAWVGFGIRQTGFEEAERGASD